MLFRNAVKEKAHHRLLRQRPADRAAQALCTGCGRVPAEPGVKMCESCGAERRAADQARRAKAKEQEKPYAGRCAERCRRADRD